ncbi:hypothetical protein E2C01_095011 [Portunus trituberculatus]|uniref:Uncharacterized protein n=1 Tax=Portunus trituberculatus TaxID=210409 RepID=A0A5B7K372_PORTR|nr:hypothetical protein [Portunus trituberculatus]
MFSGDFPIFQAMSGEKFC